MKATLTGGPMDGQVRVTRKRTEAIDLIHGNAVVRYARMNGTTTFAFAGTLDGAGDLMPRLPVCPSCGQTGRKNYGCPSCPGYWFTDVPDEVPSYRAAESGKGVNLAVLTPLELVRFVRALRSRVHQKPTYESTALLADLEKDAQRIISERYGGAGALQLFRSLVDVK